MQFIRSKRVQLVAAVVLALIGAVVPWFRYPELGFEVLLFNTMLWVIVVGLNVWEHVRPYDADTSDS